MEAMKVLGLEEVNRSLVEHKLWVETVGDRGTRAQFQKHRLPDVDLSDRDLSGAEFADCAMIGMHFSRATLALVNLAGCDLRYSIFDRARLNGANLSGANLTGADLTAITATPIEVKQADGKPTGHVIAANFANAKLRGARLKGARLRGAVLRGADLSSADLRDADLTGAILDGATLEGADSRGTIYAR
jgi:uncharacterized protein YjbI with pentapeptide repeats